MELQHTDVLIRLLMAHFISDFLLQPNSWVTAKKTKLLKAAPFYYHIGLVGFTTYLFLGEWLNWQIPLIVMVSHFFIDIGKVLSKKDNVLAFSIDQLLHILVILIAWYIYTDQGSSISQIIGSITVTTKAWWIALGYLIATTPLAVLIGYLTRKWSEELNEDKERSLKDAGKWIGMLERALILTFIFTGELRAIGFLLAAKSVFRFGDLRDTQDRKKTEYILIGTLISFTSSILLGLLITYFFK